MPYLVVEKNSSEWIYSDEPIKDDYFNCWSKNEDKHGESIGECVELPKGTIKKIIGIELNYNDKPFKI